MRADVEIPFGSQKQIGKDAALLEPNGLIAPKSPRLKGTVASLPLIESVGTPDGWKTWKDVVSGDPKPDIFIDTYGAALNLTVQGNGIALVNQILAQHALQSGQLEIAQDVVVPCKEGYFLRINQTNPTAQHFRDWLLGKIYSQT